MDKHIEFKIKYCDTITCGKSIITKDESIIFEPAPSISSFSVHLYDWSFELATQRDANNRIFIINALATQCFLKCEHTTLIIPKARRGSISLKLNFHCADGIYYSDYVSFTRKKYFDPNKRIYAVGDVTAKGEYCIEFASGQFAVFDEKEVLIAVYIDLD